MSCWWVRAMALEKWWNSQEIFRDVNRNECWCCLRSWKGGQWGEMGIGLHVHLDIGAEIDGKSFSKRNCVVVQFSVFSLSWKWCKVTKGSEIVFENTFKIILNCFLMLIDRKTKFCWFSRKFKGFYLKAFKVFLSPKIVFKNLRFRFFDKSIPSYTMWKLTTYKNVWKFFFEFWINIFNNR